MSLLDNEIRARIAREAAEGRGTCGACRRTGRLDDALVVQYGGAVVYVVCRPCILEGHEVVMGRNERGITVRTRRSGRLVLASRVPDVKRIATP